MPLYTVLFGDMDTAALILHCDSPREQKALGRKVQNFNEKTWKEECRELVMAGNKAKVGWGCSMQGL